VDLGFTAILSSSSSIFFRQLPYELAEPNSTKTGHMLVLVYITGRRMERFISI